MYRTYCKHSSLIYLKRGMESFIFYGKSTNCITDSGIHVIYLIICCSTPSNLRSLLISKLYTYIPKSNFCKLYRIFPKIRKMNEKRKLSESQHVKACKAGNRFHQRFLEYWSCLGSCRDVDLVLG